MEAAVSASVLGHDLHVLHLRTCFCIWVMTATKQLDALFNCDWLCIHDLVADLG